MILNIFREAEKQKWNPLESECPFTSGEKATTTFQEKKAIWNPSRTWWWLCDGTASVFCRAFTDETTNSAFHSKILKKNAFSLRPNTEVYKNHNLKTTFGIYSACICLLFSPLSHLFNDLKHQSGTKSKSGKRHLTSAAVSSQRAAKLCLDGWWRTCSSL